MGQFRFEGASVLVDCTIDLCHVDDLKKVVDVWLSKKTAVSAPTPAQVKKEAVVSPAKRKGGVAGARLTVKRPIRFIPPTEELPVDSKARLDRAGAWLMKNFSEAQPRKYTGRRTPEEVKQAAIARSYILNNEEAMVQQWIEHFKESPA